jgi:acyl-ACP thioesterase
MILEFHSFMCVEMPAWPGVVQVEVFLSEITSMKAYVDYIFRDSRGNVIVRGTSIWVMVDIQSHRPVSCREVHRFMEQYDPQNHTPHSRYQFPQEVEADNVVTARHLVTRLETDFNGHMNNREFVRLAFSIIDSSAMEEHTIREMHVRFQQECHAGETLDCRCAANEDGRITIRIDKPDRTVACIVSTTWI